MVGRMGSPYAHRATVANMMPGVEPMAINSVTRWKRGGPPDFMKIKNGSRGRPRETAVANTDRQGQLDRQGKFEVSSFTKQTIQDRVQKKTVKDGTRWCPEAGP